ncbi:protein kinase [Paenactinomyces guangxiensis]|uniref:Protein kinase n=1 Tax=Paenactinomyces guangxiensis TaxID=1490290 RepID=A0A7W2AAK8_9BACL|nr:protein kinase [Paenactinomyces guangxiensis]MBA4496309.1 protein kinase [Paenactinomyces guangxiensis]MBH8593455.1 protein kinase [Paenactinomyces guangxiensis]
MAKVISIGQPANDSERKAIAYLRDHLPKDWSIYHNFELRQGQEVFEIDLAILAPHALYLVDVKGTQGLIDVYGSKWYPEGRQPYHSPLAKLRQHARIMSTIIRESNPGKTELRKAHVQATVLLTADTARINDPSGIDGPDVIHLKHCLKYFRDTSRIPEHRLKDIRSLHRMIYSAIQGKANPRSSAQCFGNWQVEERLGGNNYFTEYRAKHSLLGKSSGMVRLRVYQTDPYQEEEDWKEEFKKLSTAYQAVALLPTHPNILGVKDLFLTEEKDRVVIVTEDVNGQALRQHIRKTNLALTFDQKLQVMRDVLSALDHAHQYGVIHRNLTPDAVLVTRGGQSRLTDFDFARIGSRTSTIALQIEDHLDHAYQAPECYKDPTQVSVASDLYAAGVIFYELLVGEHPFKNIDHLLDLNSKFPNKPSSLKPDLPKEIDGWLQKFCEFDPTDRYTSADTARKLLDQIILPEVKSNNSAGHRQTVQPLPDDFNNLPQDFILANRFRIQEKLGSGGFGVAYKVFDSYADVVRVIKIVTKDRHSVFERIRREYLTLTHIPEHPYVVRVFWADRFNDSKQTPYIVFEYVEGLDVSDLIDAEVLSVEDTVQMIRQAAEGLAHIHKHGVYHQDIKPSNLLWTDKGVRIIDFNVAVSEREEGQIGGGTRRYLPPDYNFSIEATVEDRIDRDLYALGITFYECLTGHYPFDEPTPPLRKPPKDPKQFKGCADLSSALIRVLMKMIAPERKDRYSYAEALLHDFNEVKRYRSILATSEIYEGSKAAGQLSLTSNQPNFNPFVSHLLTLYSQSQVSNSGTRGLDEIGKETYVTTYLDERLQPALLKGELRLVIISGNAGDGKTAFIQQFETWVESKGAQMQRGANGAVFQLKGHTFISNYDGSQDEGDVQNDEVLQKFFAPFRGKDASSWPVNQTRIIAINEGRLVDFFLEHEEEYPLIAQYIQKGLAGREPQEGIAVINLNLRSVVAKPDNNGDSILERLILSMTQKKYWEACTNCDIKDKCYAFHNASTFQDPKVGPKVLERLKMLYTITHLRGRLHMTMRDVRSALAYMLVGTKDCNGIHQLYQTNGEENIKRILESFYFNSWLGGSEVSADRLITHLREIDIAQVSNPALDRELGFLNPETKKMSRFHFSQRPRYDEELIDTLFQNLPRDYTSKNRKQLVTKHREYLAYMRRKHFFERRDSGWKDMLPYTSVQEFLKLISEPDDISKVEVTTILQAINRGEGLSNTEQLGNQLALRVRKVEHGTIHSYRLFDGMNFSLTTEKSIHSNPYVESLPQHLFLQYDSGNGHKVALKINLDVFEMLMRLNKGYRPSVEEEEGFYISLNVFKNILSAAPYREVLLTENGYDFFRMIRDEKGVLYLDKVGKEEAR